MRVNTFSSESQKCVIKSLLQCAISAKNSAYYCFLFHTYNSHLYEVWIGYWKCVKSPIQTFVIVHKYTPTKKNRVLYCTTYISPCIPISSLLFNYSFLSPPYVPPTSTITPSCLFFFLLIFQLFSFLSLSLSQQNYRIQAAQTNDNNNSLKCCCGSCPLFLLLPLSSSLSFSCPSPKVAISHPFPACST